MKNTVSIIFTVLLVFGLNRVEAETPQNSIYTSSDDLQKNEN